MDTDFEEAIRNIWHVTSLKMGENIFESRCIWGKDPDGAANFHPSQISANIPSEDSEISIGFRWEGKIQLLDFNYFDFNELKAGVMYVVLTEGFYNPTIESAKIWTCKIPRGTDNHFKCVDVVPFKNMLNDRGFKKQFNELKTECLKTFSVRVPYSQDIPTIIAQLNVAKKKTLLQRFFSK